MVSVAGSLLFFTLAGQSHVEEGEQQLPPVSYRAHHAIDFEAVTAVIDFHLLITAAAFEEEASVLLAFPGAMKDPDGKVAVSATLCNFLVHNLPSTSHAATINC